MLAQLSSGPPQAAHRGGNSRLPNYSTFSIGYCIGAETTTQGLWLHMFETLRLLCPLTSQFHHNFITTVQITTFIKRLHNIQQWRSDTRWSSFHLPRLPRQGRHIREEGRFSPPVFQWCYDDCGNRLSSRSLSQYLEDARHFFEAFLRKRRMRIVLLLRQRMSMECWLMTNPGRCFRSFRPRIRYSLQGEFRVISVNSNELASYSELMHMMTHF